MCGGMVRVMKAYNRANDICVCACAYVCCVCVSGWAFVCMRGCVCVYE